MLEDEYDKIMALYNDGEVNNSDKRKEAVLFVIWLSVVSTDLFKNNYINFMEDFKPYGIKNL